MKVIVTGCHGFLGHHVAQELAGAGHDVLGIDRIANARSKKTERIGKSRVPFLEVDLCDHKRLFRTFSSFKADAIIHLAAQYSVAYTTENLHSYIRSNLAGFCYVLEAAKVARVPRLLYASSIAVSDDCKPRGLYGATKAFNEQAAHAYTNRAAFSAVGLRYGVIYGPMLRTDTGIYRVVTDQLRGRVGPLSSEHRNKNGYVDVRDAAKCTRLLAERKPAERSSVFTIVAEDGKADLGDVAIAAAAAIGREPRLPKGYTVRARPPFDAERMRRLETAAGWTPKTTLDEGIGDTVEWLQSRKNR